MLRRLAEGGLLAHDVARLGVALDGQRPRLVSPPLVSGVSESGCLAPESIPENTQP